MSSFIEALDAEISRLKAELASDPRWVKLRETERLRELYVSDHPQPLIPQGAVLPAIRLVRSPALRTKQALDAAEAFLRNRKSGFFHAIPVPTAQILEHLQRAEIKVVGRKPGNSLSAMLSHSERFRSHGRAGWTLTEDDQNTEAADIPSQEEFGGFCGASA